MRLAWRGGAERGGTEELAVGVGSHVVVFAVDPEVSEDRMEIDLSLDSHGGELMSCMRTCNWVMGCMQYCMAQRSAARCSTARHGAAQHGAIGERVSSCLHAGGRAGGRAVRAGRLGLGRSAFPLGSARSRVI